MFRRTQPRPPVPVKTFRVLKPIGSDQVRANEVGSRYGVLSFWLDGELVKAYSPQMWLTVEIMEGE